MFIQKSKCRKSTRLLISGLWLIITAQILLILKLYLEKDDKTYAVNLVKINTEKDSIDYQKLKAKFSEIDQSIRHLNHFLSSRNLPNSNFLTLNKDSLSKSVYLTQISNRYSQYLVNLEQKLKEIPLGSPTSGYISSNFGNRIHPIPSKASLTVVSDEQSIKDSTESRNPNMKPIQTYAKIQFHKGIDFAVPIGTDVRCTAIGKVVFAGIKEGYGHCVIISHGNGLATLYAHLSKILVTPNEKVNLNQVIAKSGNSGRSTGPHLHYEVHQNNTPINPKLFLNL